MFSRSVCQTLSPPLSHSHPQSRLALLTARGWARGPGGLSQRVFQAIDNVIQSTTYRNTRLFLLYRILGM